MIVSHETERLHLWQQKILRYTPPEHVYLDYCLPDSCETIISSRAGLFRNKHSTADPLAGFPGQKSHLPVSDESIPEKRGRKNAFDLSHTYHLATTSAILMVDSNLKGHSHGQEGRAGHPQSPPAPGSPGTGMDAESGRRAHWRSQ